MAERWSGPGGYRQVLAVGLPLVISLASHTVMTFTDRVFLASYDLNAIAAAVPGGITAFLFTSFFVGLGGYVNVFVAQYTGARRPDRLGASLWAGVHLSLVAAALLALMWLAAGPLFRAAGHPPEVQELEIAYFRILMLGSGLVVLYTVLGCYYSGRGKTLPVALVQLCGMALNIPLDYALINGLWGLPRLGIVGAGVATVAAWGLICLLYAAIIFRPANARRYALWRTWRFDRELFGRLMRFGLPAGGELFLELIAFTFFIFMLGRLGMRSLAASNIVLSIDMLAFLPMIGMSIGLSTLVGQSVGSGRVRVAHRATMSTLQLTCGYLALVALVFLFLPEPLLHLFRPRDMDAAELAALTVTGAALLRYVAVYTILEGVALSFVGALKGAGDSAYVVKAVAGATAGVMVAPLVVTQLWLGLGLDAAWAVATCFIATLALAYWLRYRSGRWRRMSVMEKGLAPRAQAD